MISFTVMSPEPLASPIGQAESCLLPRAMFTNGQDFSNGDSPISTLVRTPARGLAGYAPKVRRNNGIDTIWMPW